jgi:outer membrane receptor protein involved in Fe transport
VLGTGDLLDVSQGRYVTADMSGEMTWHGLDFSLALDNVTNRAANRFAFGNPFTLAVRDQTTPLRPRNLRFGIAAKW